MNLIYWGIIHLLMEASKYINMQEKREILIKSQGIAFKEKRMDIILLDSEFLMTGRSVDALQDITSSQEKIAPSVQTIGIAREDFPLLCLVGQGNILCLIMKIDV